MSGGAFGYRQHTLESIAEDIEDYILRNGNRDALNFSRKTIKEFRRAVVLLERAAIYTQRIDWLLSGDDGEGAFHERLGVELAELNRKSVCGDYENLE